MRHNAYAKIAISHHRRASNIEASREALLNKAMQPSSLHSILSRFIQVNSINVFLRIVKKKRKKNPIIRKNFEERKYF